MRYVEGGGGGIMASPSLFRVKAEIYLQFAISVCNVMDHISVLTKRTAIVKPV